MIDHDTDGTVDKAQIISALEFLEYAHGQALELERAGEAYAYNEAIELIEEAIEDNLRHPDEIPPDEKVEQYREDSQAAREQGLKTAAMLDEYYDSDYEYAPESLLDRFLEWIYAN